MIYNEIPCCRRQKRGSASGNLSCCLALSVMKTEEAWLRGLNTLKNFSRWLSLPWRTKIITMHWFGLNRHQREFYRRHNIFIIPQRYTHANILCPPRAGFFYHKDTVTDKIVIRATKSQETFSSMTIIIKNIVSITPTQYNPFRNIEL